MGASSELFLQMREEEVAQRQGIAFEHLIDAKKDNLKSAVTVIETAVKEGQYDELKALILAKKGGEFFKLLEAAVRPLAEDKYVDRIGKDYSIHDTKVETADIVVKYDYAACNDPEWIELSGMANKFSQLLKERETFLKAVTKPTPIVIEDTGEVVTINPPIRTGKTGLKLTIK